MNPIDGLVLARHWERDTTWLEVVRAAPRVLFGADVLRGIRRGDGGHEVSIDRIGVGAILHIRARGRTLVYRLAEYDEKRDIFTGVWPD